MKALRVKLFGKYITRLPEFNLTRHEDVPLPVSSARCSEQIISQPVEFKRFVPSQDLSGCMIPMTGQDVAKLEARKRIEQERLYAEYQKRLSGKSQSALACEEDNLDEGVELIGNEDRMVCYYNESSGVDALTKSAEDAPQGKITTKSGSSGTAIQLSMGNQITNPASISASKWVFSASIQLSLTKAPVDDVPTPVSLLRDDDNGRIEQTDDDEEEAEEEQKENDFAAEEGVEIVPLSRSNDISMEIEEPPSKLDNDADNDVAVLYVKNIVCDGVRGCIATTGDSMSDNTHLNSSNEDNTAIEQSQTKLNNDGNNDVAVLHVKEIVSGGTHDCIASKGDCISSTGDSLSNNAHLNNSNKDMAEIERSPSKNDTDDGGNDNMQYVKEVLSGGLWWGT